MVGILDNRTMISCQDRIRNRIQDRSNLTVRILTFQFFTEWHLGSRPLLNYQEQYSGTGVKIPLI